MLINATAAGLPLASQSVHTVVTSPPYFSGLRQYAGSQVSSWENSGYDTERAGPFTPHALYPPGAAGPHRIQPPNSAAPLGHETTAAEYITRLCLVFDEVWRVLRPDGVAWLNLGDCFTDSNLELIPFRVAQALGARGWCVRNETVWGKLNAMPESEAAQGWRFSDAPCACTSGRQESALAAEQARLGAPRHTAGLNTRRERAVDPNCPLCGGTGREGEVGLRKAKWRHTRAHEALFMLTKGGPYWGSAELAREAAAKSRWPAVGEKHAAARARGEPAVEMEAHGRNPRSVIWQSTDSGSAGKNFEHFAMFPVGLVAPLIRATCPPYACLACGAPWAQEVLKTNAGYQDRNHGGRTDGLARPIGGAAWSKLKAAHPDRAGDWRPTCACQAEPVAGVVLDPFCGSGTTGEAARELGRRFIGTDISLPYLRDSAMPRAEGLTSVQALRKLPLFESL